MEKEEEKKVNNDQNDSADADEETEALEILLFQVSECYVYLIPPRKSAASYRADEWNVNKWAWEGILKVVSKGEECIIKLEDKSTGELYARAFLRKGELHPVEPVIDSSRYFVLRVEENIGGRLRHAFIGIGFRERTEAYDFQAALHDHINYLDKKKTAEEMEQQFQKTSSVDYSLKDGETLHLQLKNKSSGKVKSKFFDQGMNNLSLEDKGNRKEPVICIKPPPPPSTPLSPDTAVQKTLSDSVQDLNLEGTSRNESRKDLSVEGTSKDESPNSTKELEDTKEQHSTENPSTEEVPDDDFGDFQAAG